MAKYCKHCGNRLLDSSHYCREKGRILRESSDVDFIISAAIGAATDSAILGTLLGGSLLGGVLGDIFDGDLMD